MKQPYSKYSVKPHRVKIFHEVTVETEGYTSKIKEYIHPEGTYLSAYVRQVSMKESESGGSYDGSDIEVVLNNRELDQTMFIEFKGQTYQLGAPDHFEFLNTDIKVRASKVAVGNYDSVRYKEWSI